MSAIPPKADVRHELFLNVIFFMKKKVGIIISYAFIVAGCEMPSDNQSVSSQQSSADAAQESMRHPTSLQYSNPAVRVLKWVKPHNILIIVLIFPILR